MRRFGLLGKSLSHSFSKGYFTQKFAELKLSDCRYENLELSSIDQLLPLIESNPDIEGLNVTIPYKQEVISLLAEQNDVVKKTGACNCIKVKEGKLYGFNTDVAGFLHSLKPKLQPHHTQALVLGNGGASKAVQYTLDELEIPFCLVSRRQQEGQLGYEDIGDEAMRKYTIIINTTPLGMFPNVDADPSIPYELLTDRHLLFDLIYNPEKTSFLKKGAAQGAQIVNGQEMLVLQAEESWRIWNDASL
ncbi:MAG TPA: shikimate dehydrogenase [Flavisolibacter sp.]|jgi:shikimate dehydrogenase|nr:shikimate dehydrogenase [Flavisolibacter sp.]